MSQDPQPSKEGVSFKETGASIACWVKYKKDSKPSPQPGWLEIENTSNIVTIEKGKLCEVIDIKESTHKTEEDTNIMIKEKKGTKWNLSFSEESIRSKFLHHLNHSVNFANHLATIFNQSPVAPLPVQVDLFGSNLPGGLDPEPPKPILKQNPTQAEYKEYMVAKFKYEEWENNKIRFKLANTPHPNSPKLPLQPTQAPTQPLAQATSGTSSPELSHSAKKSSEGRTSPKISPGHILRSSTSSSPLRQNRTSSPRPHPKIVDTENKEPPGRQLTESEPPDGASATRKKKDRRSLSAPNQTRALIRDASSSSLGDPLADPQLMKAKSSKDGGAPLISVSPESHSSLLEKQGQTVEEYKQAMIAKFKYQEWENKQRSVKMNNNNPADQPAIQKITINFKQGRKAIRYLPNVTVRHEVAKIAETHSLGNWETQTPDGVSFDADYTFGQFVAMFSVTEINVVECEKNPWRRVPVTEAGGQTSTLEQVIKNKLTLVVLARSIGDIVVQQFLFHLEKDVQSLLQLGIQVIVVGKGNVAQVPIFRDHTSFSEGVYCTSDQAFWGYLINKEPLPKATPDVAPNTATTEPAPPEIPIVHHFRLKKKTRRRSVSSTTDKSKEFTKSDTSPGAPHKRINREDGEGGKPKCPKCEKPLMLAESSGSGSTCKCKSRFTLNFSELHSNQSPVFNKPIDAANHLGFFLIHPTFGVKPLPAPLLPFNGQKITKAVQLFCDSHPNLLWGRAAIVPELPPFQSYEELKSSTAQHLTTICPNFEYEFGRSFSLDTRIPYLTHQMFYTNTFSKQEHINFMGMLSIGPIIISIEKAPSFIDRQALVWHSGGQTQVMLRSADEGTTTIKSILEIVVNQVFKTQLVEEVTLLECHSSAVINELKSYEFKNCWKTFKFGVLNAVGPTVTEDALYDNDSMSNDFLEFMGTLANKIELDGWKEFKGGLDETMGTYSYYTKFESNEVMYHVSQLINKLKDDPTRKRHIGNDIIVVIFKETEQPIVPQEFDSQFNHLWVIVEKVKADKATMDTCYRVEVVAKLNVGPFQPYLTSNNIFTKNEFREWFTTKLINGEREIIENSVSFSKRVKSTKRKILTNLVSSHLTAAGISESRSSTLSAPS